MLKIYDDWVGEDFSCLLRWFVWSLWFELIWRDKLSIRSNALQMVPFVKSTGFIVNKFDLNYKKLAFVVLIMYVSNKYSKNDSINLMCFN